MKKRLLLLILGAFVLVVILLRRAFGAVLSLLLIGGICAYLIMPLLKALEKRMKRGPAIILSFALILAFLAMLIMLILPAVTEQAARFAAVLPTYGSALRDMLDKIGKKLPMLGDPEKMLSESLSFSRGLSALSRRFSPENILSFFTTFLLVPVVAYYLLRDREQLKKTVLYFLPGRMRESAGHLAKDINRQMREYVNGEAKVILLISGLMTLALWLAGFSYPLILGILMGIFNVVPYIGPLLGSVPILLVAGAEGTGRMLLALALILLVQEIDSAVVQPRVIGDSTRIHPLTVLLCVEAGNALGSVAGMVLAIPVYMILRIVFGAFYRYFTERKQKFLQKSKIYT